MGQTVADTCAPPPLRPLCSPHHPMAGAGCLAGLPGAPDLREQAREARVVSAEMGHAVCWRRQPAQDIVR